jgi:hypothetical protein
MQITGSGSDLLAQMSKNIWKRKVRSEIIREKSILKYSS